MGTEIRIISTLINALCYSHGHRVEPAPPLYFYAYMLLFIACLHYIAYSGNFMNTHVISGLMTFNPWGLQAHSSYSYRSSENGLTCIWEKKGKQKKSECSIVTCGIVTCLKINSTTDKPPLVYNQLLLLLKGLLKTTRKLLLLLLSTTIHYNHYRLMLLLQKPPQLFH